PLPVRGHGVPGHRGFRNGRRRGGGWSERVTRQVFRLGWVHAISVERRGGTRRPYALHPARPCYASHMPRTRPSLDTLRHIGWRGPLPEAAVARVVAQHRAGYELHDGFDVFAAQPAGHFLKRSLDP